MNLKSLLPAFIAALILTAVTCTTTQPKNSDSHDVNERVISKYDMHLGMPVENPYKVVIPEEKDIWLEQKGSTNYAYRKKKVVAAINTSGAVEVLFGADVFHVEYYSQGLAAYLTSASPRRWGYLDIKGRVAIEPRFSSAGPFHNGLALVQEGGERTFIDTRGRKITEDYFSNAVPFYHGSYTFVKKKGEQNYRVMNSKGEYLSAPVFSLADVRISLGTSGWKQQQAFESGVIRSRVGSNYGFRSLDGSWVVGPRYHKASDMRHGIATVAERSGGKIRYGAIEKNGSPLLPVEFKSLSTAWANTYEDDDDVTIAGVHEEEGCVIYNARGKAIFGPVKEIDGKRCLAIEPFKYDKAKVVLLDHSVDGQHASMKSAVTTWIDRKGTVLFPGTVMMARNFNRHGLAYFTNYDPSVLALFFDSDEAAREARRVAEKFVYQMGFINDKGEKVLTIKKHAGDPIYMNYDVSMPDDSFGYRNISRITHSNTFHGDRSYISAYGAALEKKPFSSSQGDYSTSLVPFCEEGQTPRCGYVDLRSGAVVIERRWTNAGAFHEGLAIVSPGGYRIIREKLE